MDDATRIPSKPHGSRAGRDVYCYFYHDVKVRARYDARRLLDKLGLANSFAVPPGQLSGEFL